MQYPIMKITKMDKFNVEDMWPGLLHIFGENIFKKSL